jgi:hypothetical protein
MDVCFFPNSGRGRRLCRSFPVLSRKSPPTLRMCTKSFGFSRTVAYTRLNVCGWRRVCMVSMAVKANGGARKSPAPVLVSCTMPTTFNVFNVPSVNSKTRFSPTETSIFSSAFLSRMISFLPASDAPSMGRSKLTVFSLKSSIASRSMVIHCRPSSGRTRKLTTRRPSASLMPLAFRMEESTSSSMADMRSSILLGLFAAYDASISLEMISYAPAITPIENTPTAMENTTSRVRALLSHRS